MGTIALYGKLLRNVEVKQPHVVKSPEEVAEGKPIIRDAKQVTLAEYDVNTKNAITAHRLKDYRRKHFNLILLPKIETLFEKVLEGSEFWNALLNESTDPRR